MVNPFSTTADSLAPGAQRPPAVPTRGPSLAGSPQTKRPQNSGEAFTSRTAFPWFPRNGAPAHSPSQRPRSV